MNNKGFAITTILYGVLILFCLLLVSMLGILSSYRGNLEKLIEKQNGEGNNRSNCAREIIKNSKPNARADIVEPHSGSLASIDDFSTSDSTYVVGRELEG